MSIRFSLVTNRLLIDPLTAGDAAFILELLNTEGWIRFIGNRNITSLIEANAYIQKIVESKNISYWVIKLKDGEMKTGIVTFIKRDFLEHSDIGFAFLPIFFKKGYAYEAASAVVKELVCKHNITHILATTLPENISSITLLKKLGLVFENEMETDKETLHVYGASADKLII